MAYTIKEIYYTLQGEGAQSGRSAVFCRFAGCNLWTGREQDRSKAICQFCDTDFDGTDGPGGGKFDIADQLAGRIEQVWKQHTSQAKKFVVCTGGEPLLQFDQSLLDALHDLGFEVAIETNGTQIAPTGVDWVCVSPKAGTDLTITKGHELKLVYPQEAAIPEAFESLEFDHFFLQPMDNENRVTNTRLAMEYCLKHPQWKLGLQFHKMLNIP